MMVSRKSVLVTGITGFIGRALCERLIREKWRVKGIVRSLKKPSTLPGSVEVVTVDTIGPSTDWSRALSGVDTVIHLAARAHVTKESALDPLAAFREVNAAGTKRLASLCAAAGVKRFIYLSSVKVNGEESAIPFTEQCVPRPCDPYGVSKWEAEQTLHEIANTDGIEIVILRPPLVYGPEVKANFLELVKLVTKGIPLPLASVNNRRSLIYIGNLIDAVILCTVAPGAAGNTYFVSDGEDVSTPELIRRISDSLGRRTRLFRFPPRLMRAVGIAFGKRGAVDRLTGSLTVDIARIRRELGWNPPHSMEQGLKYTIEWFQRTSNSIQKTGCEL